MTEALLTVDQVVAGYQPDLPIVDGVSLRVDSGELVTIIGPNGAGKSTLIKAIAGLVAISGGVVRYHGRDLTNRPTHALVSSGIAYVPQTANVFTSLSVQHNLSVAAHTLGARKRLRIDTAYSMFPILAEKRRQRARVLSGGQRQMLALAMALVAEPGLIMLDEPTAGLAPRVVGEVFERVKKLAASGVAVLLVEQNAKAALAVSNRAYVLAEGRNQLEGAASALLADAKVGEIYLGQRRLKQ